ncbi:MAG: flagellin lysine-N-methylase [Lachnospiraceae bacterium]|nr:flagellin lysine-N-methylase [Ruminococcus sp.]MCM1276376.1 flagellin lysine-N-methylase [Lachnospiraceae bacterium]
MYYRQPRYFGNFKCVGGTCSNSCCVGWRIDWTKEEIDKITSAPECSEELRELTEKSFTKPENREHYAVILGEGQRCPFLTEDNFCKIQRELGAEYLSFTCTIYPRHFIAAGEAVYRYGNMSCPEVMNKLLNKEKSMVLSNVAAREIKLVKGTVMNTRESLAAHPELQYRGELLELFYEIISDKKHDVETALILGAVVAQTLSNIVAAKNYNEIPNAIKKIKPQLHGGELLRSIENIEPNYNVKLGEAGEMLKSVFQVNIMNALTDNDGNLNTNLYEWGEQRLAETFKDRPFYLRNIALNLLLEFVLPFKFTDKTIFENYSIFAAAFALFKLNVIATAEYTDRMEKSAENETPSCDTEKYVRDFSAMISRNLCHNDENAKKLLDKLRERKITMPADLALLIK